MILAEQIQTPDITEKLTRYKSFGGVINFKIFRVTEVTSVKETHLLTAQKTLELLKQDIDSYFTKLATSLGTNRADYFKVTSFALSVNDGKQITPEEFFGPYFNFEEQRPILRGKLFNEYYHYDDNEISHNVVTVKANNGEYVTQGYADAFLNPPYSFGRNITNGHNMTNFEIGKFFLDFNQFLFDDINRITVYEWSTDCSNYFEAGKEWWGSFFWTVQSPSKDWFIGIAASTTD